MLKSSKNIVLPIPELYNLFKEPAAMRYLQLIVDVGSPFHTGLHDGSQLFLKEDSK